MSSQHSQLLYFHDFMKVVYLHDLYHFVYLSFTLRPTPQRKSLEAASHKT